MCTVLTACSIVRYCTAEVGIFKICVQFLPLVVLYGTVTAEVRIFKICVQFLLLVVLYGTVL